MTAGHDVTIPPLGPLPAVPSFAAFPPGATRGVVVLQELLGRQPEIDRVVERFAARGYAAVAPDFFSSPGLVPCVRAVMEAMKTGEGLAPALVLRARDWLCAESGVDATHVGLIGFCFGGGFALATGRGFGAVSANYGDVPRVAALRGSPPVIACFGGRDRLFGKKGPLLDQRLSELGITHETHVFPDVGHSFLTDGHHPVTAFLTRPIFHLGHGGASADEAWRRIEAFFDRQLGGAPG